MRGIPMKRLLLIPTTVVTAFLAFAFLQPGTAGGVLRAVAPTVLSALPSAVLANGSVQSPSANGRRSGSSAQGQASAQSSRSIGALSNTSDPLLNPETKDTTEHAVSTAG